MMHTTIFSTPELLPNTEFTEFFGENCKMSALNGLESLLKAKQSGGIFITQALSWLQPVPQAWQQADLLLVRSAEAAGVNNLAGATADGHGALALSAAVFGAAKNHALWQAMVDAAQAAPLAGWSAWLHSAVTNLPQFASMSKLLLDASVLAPFSDASWASGRPFDIEYFSKRSHASVALTRPAKEQVCTELAAQIIEPGGMGTPVHIELVASASALTANLPLVSCLMVTRGYLMPARYAIDSFRAQTYANAELIIVADRPGNEVSAYVDSLNDHRIRYLRPEPEWKSLGELRNISLAQARGALVCQWDDDDMSDPARLDISVQVLLATGSIAVFMERWLMWWPAKASMVASVRRPWEGSMLARREAMPPYPLQARGEDSDVATLVSGGGRVVLFDMPRLYVYTVTGQNTWDSEHFRGLWRGATWTAEGPTYANVLRELGRRVPIAAYDAAWQAANNTAGAEHATKNAANNDHMTLTSAKKTAKKGVLIALELGRDPDAAAALLPVARGLSRSQIPVTWALPDAAMGSQDVYLGGFEWFAAPTARHPEGQALSQSMGHVASAPRAASWAQLLAQEGWSNPEQLMGLVTAWRSILQASGAGAVLACGAPTAVLAAMSLGIPVLRLGHGLDAANSLSAWQGLASHAVPEPMAQAEAVALHWVEQALNSALIRFTVRQSAHLASFFSPEVAGPYMHMQAWPAERGQTSETAVAHASTPPPSVVLDARCHTPHMGAALAALAPLAQQHNMVLHILSPSVLEAAALREHGFAGATHGLPCWRSLITSGTLLVGPAHSLSTSAWLHAGLPAVALPTTALEMAQCQAWMQAGSASSGLLSAVHPDLPAHALGNVLALALAKVPPGGGAAPNGAAQWRQCVDALAALAAKA